MCTRAKAHHSIGRAPAWGTKGLLGVRKDCVQREGPRCRPCTLTPLPAPTPQRGTYLPQTYIIQEEMVVTEHVSDKEALGSFIYHLCNGKDTYRLRRRATRRRE